MEQRKDVSQCLAYIEAHCGEKLTAEKLAAQFGYSSRHFCRMFRAAFGVTPGAYLRGERLKQAARELERGRSVTEIAVDCGFDTPAGFDKAFRKHFRMSPSEYRHCRSSKNTAATALPTTPHPSDLRA